MNSDVIYALFREMRQWMIFIVTVTLLGLLAHFSKYWAYDKIQDCLQTRIQGKFEPHYLLFQFRIRNAQFRIQDKIRVENGDVVVRYQILGLTPSPRFRIQVASENAVLFLEGKWFKMYPFEQTTLDKFFTDVTIGKGGIQGLHSVLVKTKDFSFKLAPPSPSHTAGKKS